MPRLIDADALIEEWHENPPSYDMDRVFAALAQAPTVSGWNSIDDELPEPVSTRYMEDIKPVLLYSPKGGYYVGWYYGPKWNGKKLFINRTSRDSWQYITTKVTHWMPLPEPPEVENEV